MIDQDVIKTVFGLNYVIFPVTSDNVTFKIHIHRGQKKAVIKQIYTKRTIDKAIEELYKKIYAKSKEKQE